MDTPTCQTCQYFLGEKCMRYPPFEAEALDDSLSTSYSFEFSWGGQPCGEHQDFLKWRRELKRKRWRVVAVYFNHNGERIETFYLTEEDRWVFSWKCARVFTSPEEAAKEADRQEAMRRNSSAIEVEEFLAEEEEANEKTNV